MFEDPRTKDEVWLPYVAEKGWIALSHNKRQKRVKLERDAAMNSGAAVFYLTGKQNVDVISNLIATVPKIIRFREKHEPPFMARVRRPEAKFKVGSRPGNIEMSLTKEDWLTLLAKGR